MESTGRYKQTNKQAKGGFRLFIRLLWVRGVVGGWGRTGYRGLRLLKTGTRRGSLTWAGTRASERGAPVAQGRWSRSSGSGPRSPTSAAKPEPEGTRVNNTSMLLKHSSELALTLICKRPVVMVTQTHMPSQ